MKITLRLYRRHDIDLISLYKNPQFDFKKACIIALRGYVTKQPVLFKQPPYYVPKDEFKYGYQMFLILDDVNDADIIDYLETLRPRYRNEFIKMVIRGSVIGPIAYNCFPDEIDAAGRDVNINNTQIVLKDFPIKTRKGKGKKKKINTKSDSQPNIKDTSTTVAHNNDSDISNIPNISDIPDIPNIPFPSKEIETNNNIKNTDTDTTQISMSTNTDDSSTLEPDDSIGLDNNENNDLSSSEEEFDVFASLEEMFS